MKRLARASVRILNSKGFYGNNKCSALPAEEVTSATVDSWGWQQGKTLGVAVAGARPG